MAKVCVVLKFSDEVMLPLKRFSVLATPVTVTPACVTVMPALAAAVRSSVPMLSCPKGRFSVTGCDAPLDLKLSCP